MPNVSAYSLLTLALLTGCATPVPVAVTCPNPPPAPQVLTEPRSTEPSLTQRYDDLMREFRDSLQRAMLRE